MINYAFLFYDHSRSYWDARDPVDLTWALKSGGAGRMCTEVRHDFMVFWINRSTLEE